MEISSLDLLYQESDSRTTQASACVCLKARCVQDYAGIKAEKLVTTTRDPDQLLPL
jgi:hypothetical protein